MVNYEAEEEKLVKKLPVLAIQSLLRHKYISKFKKLHLYVHSSPTSLTQILLQFRFPLEEHKLWKKSYFVFICFDLITWLLYLSPRLWDSKAGKGVTRGLWDSSANENSTSHSDRLGQSIFRWHQLASPLQLSFLTQLRIQEDWGEDTEPKILPHMKQKLGGASKKAVSCWNTKGRVYLTLLALYCVWTWQSHKYPALTPQLTLLCAGGWTKNLLSS